ncbi:MAG: alpha-amylase family glycosyl hydrolase, partial [Planctomycetota bacterium]
SPFLKVRGHHSENANYLFVDLEISESVEAGEYEITVANEKSSATFRWAVHQRTTGTRHQGFDQSDVVYLITPDRFANGNPENDTAEDQLNEFDPSNPSKRHGGDLAGIAERLNYLSDLGVTTLWLNPVLENRGVNSYHGYKTTDFYRIDPRFGSNEDYRTLVSKAHEAGLKVIFDHVSNHIGIRHRWLKDLPTKGWLNGSIENHLLDRHYLHSVSDPHADNETRRQLKSFWFVDSMPDLNQQNEFVANYLIQNTIWWIEYSGLDGIREDTWPYTDAVFLHRWINAIENEYPNFNIVGEIWSLQSPNIARYQKGTCLPNDVPPNLNSVMDFPLSEALRRFVKGDGKLRDVHAIYAQDFLFGDPSQLMVFVDNHDMARIQFIAKGKQDRVKVALGIMLLGRGIPQLLYGTEIGMVGGESHVELRADFPGGFPNLRPELACAFTRKGRSADQQSIHQWLSRLLQIRKENSAFSEGSMIHFAPTWHQDVYRFLRINDEQTVIVIANGEPDSVDVLFDDIERYTKVKVLIDLESKRKFSTAKPLSIEGNSIRVFDLKKAIR